MANSTSTMHRMASKPITLDCFEISDYSPDLDNNLEYFDMGDEKWYGSTVSYEVDGFIIFLESLRKKFIETKDIRYWKELIRWLPESWLQTRTVTMNYENLLGMCSRGQRRFHKLTEWSDDFISWARSLPYAQEFLFMDELQ